jgi:drug/metabolite transporter (DMT)-like permease
VEATSVVWIVVAFGVAATWGLTVVINKRTLHFVDPIALNLLMRLPTLLFLAPAVTLLALNGTWGLSFDMTWEAFGYQTLNAIVTWVVAFNAYFLALRLGSLGVVAPIMATDPLFAGLFAVVILGSALGISLTVGLLIATGGVALLARWTETTGVRRGEAVAEPPGGAELVPPLLAAADPPPGRVAPAVDTSAGTATALALPLTDADADRRRRWQMIALALVAAAGWGLGPVIVEAATRSIGGASAGLILQNQLMAILFLLPIVALRKRVFLRRMDRREQRFVALLIIVSGALETIFALAYYLLIDEIGAVLTVLIIATSPIFSVLGGVVFLKERYSRRLALGGLITIAGVALAVVQPW